MENAIMTTATQGEIAQSQEVRAGMFERFIAYLDASPKTIATYKMAIRQLFNYLAENGIRRPLREDILAYRESLKASGHKPSTVSLYMVAVRLFFQWAKQENLYPNVAEHIKGARLDKGHKRDYLTSRQVKAVMGGVDTSDVQGLRDYAILALMVTGGLRTIEVARANVGDLGTVGDSVVIFVQGKGHEERGDYVKIPPQTEKAIRDYLRARGKVDRTAPLFASESHNSLGKRLSTRSISGMVKARMVEAGYSSDRLTAHSLRHTAVTLSLLAGKPLAEVSKFARHSSIATTMIYNHSIEMASNTCANAIANAIF